MWDPPNDTYAAYCNPNLSGRAICALQNNCCGPGMVQDGTYGTHWEFTPKGDHGSIDSVNLSTNYGSGPRTPPHLCPFGDGTDCVAIAADIFFNVPVKWTTNMSCLFTTAQKSVMGANAARLTVRTPTSTQKTTSNARVRQARIVGIWSSSVRRGRHYRPRRDDVDRSVAPCRGRVASTGEMLVRFSWRCADTTPQ